MLNVKSLKVLLLFVVIIFITASCNNKINNSSYESKESTIEKIIKKGKIDVGYLTWNPCVVKNLNDDSLSGIYVDMIEEIAGNLKVKVEWHQTSLATFIAGLNSYQFDFSVGPTFITIPRSTSVLFTDPVLYVGNSAVVLTKMENKPKTISDVLSGDYKIAVLQGQAIFEYFKYQTNEERVMVISGSDLTAPLAAVSSNHADIGFMNSVTVQQYAKEHPQVTPVLLGDEQIEILPLAWAVRQDDIELLNFLNSSIRYLKSTGRFAEYQKKYDIKLLNDMPELYLAK